MQPVSNLALALTNLTDNFPVPKNLRITIFISTSNYWKGTEMKILAETQLTVRSPPTSKCAAAGNQNLKHTGLKPRYSNTRCRWLKQHLNRLTKSPPCRPFCALTRTIKSPKSLMKSMTCPHPHLYNHLILIYTFQERLPWGAMSTYSSPSPCAALPRYWLHSPWAPGYHSQPVTLL